MYQDLVTKIEKELNPIYPNLLVSLYERRSVLTKKNFKYSGVRAYEGMVESVLRVEWNRIWDANYMGGRFMAMDDWIFKFDQKDGSCKYDGCEPNVFEAVDNLITRLKPSYVK